MIRTFSLPIITAIALIAGTMGINVALQHYHCNIPWERTDPLQIYPCEPVDQVLLERERLRLLALLHPYCKEETR